MQPTFYHLFTVQISIRNHVKLAMMSFPLGKKSRFYFKNPLERFCYGVRLGRVVREVRQHPEFEYQQWQ
jgi:hypothetical protein